MVLKRTRGKRRSDLLATALSAAVSTAFFATAFFILHRKYLALDVTNFDLLDILKIYGHLRGAGVSSLLQFYPDTAVFFAQEPAHLAGLACYLIIPSPYTLFFLQTAAVGLAIFLSSILVRRMTGSAWAGFAVALSLAANPYLFTFSVMGWRSYLLAAPFYLAFLIEEQAGRGRRAAAFLVLAGAGKVTMMFTNAVLGLILWIFSGKSKAGKPAFIFCAAFFLVQSLLAAALANHFGVKLTTEMLHLSAFGGTLPEVARTLATRPAFVFTQIFSSLNVCHLVFFASFLGLPFMAGRYFLSAAPEIAMLFLSTSSLAGHAFFRNVYPAVYNPAAYIHNNHLFLTGLLMGAFSLGFSRLYKFAGRKWDRRAAGIFAAAIPAISILAHLLWPAMIGGPMPGNLHFDRRYYAQTSHDLLGRRIAAELPYSAYVRAQWNLYPPGIVQGRLRFRAFEWNRNEIAEDYVFLDLFAFEYLLDRADYLASVKELLGRADYGAVRFEDGWLLLKKRVAGAWNEKALEFLDENNDLLSKNLFRPYRDGLRNNPVIGIDVYSPNQLAGS